MPISILYLHDRVSHICGISHTFFDEISIGTAYLERSVGKARVRLYNQKDDWRKHLRTISVIQESSRLRVSAFRVKKVSPLRLLSSRRLGVRTRTA